MLKFDSHNLIVFCDSKEHTCQSSGEVARLRNRFREVKFLRWEKKKNDTFRITERIPVGQKIMKSEAVFTSWNAEMTPVSNLISAHSNNGKVGLLISKRDDM